MQVTQTAQQKRTLALAAGVLFAVIVLTSISIYSYSAYQQASAELIIERDRQLVYLSAARLREELVKFSDELFAVARLIEASGAGVFAPESALARTRNRLVVFDGGVVVLDSAGHVLVSEPPRPEILGDDWSDRTYFSSQLASPGVFLSDIVIDGQGGTAVVVMSVPVVGQVGELAGVVVGMFRTGLQTTSAFYASIVRLRLGQSGNTYVLDGGRRIVYDSGSQEVGNLVATAGLSMDALTGIGALRTKDAAGRDIVAAHAPIPGTTWSLVTEDDWATLTADVQRYATNLLIVLGLGIVLPPLGVALLVRDQQTHVRERERSQLEAHVAGMIRESLFPRQPPTLPGWNLALHYQPAVGGGRDFYDFLLLPDGRLMLSFGEVSTAGLPAIHIISALRATLRGAAHRELSPQEALECTNTLLSPDVPPATTLTCLSAIVWPEEARVTLANAGFAAPFHCQGNEVREVEATGLPLAVMLDARYTQTSLLMAPGERLVFYSPGLLAVRNARGESFDSARLRAILRRRTDEAQDLIASVLDELKTFTGRGVRPSDDFVIAVLERTDDGQQPSPPPDNGLAGRWTPVSQISGQGRLPE